MGPIFSPLILQFLCLLELFTHNKNKYQFVPVDTVLQVREQIFGSKDLIQLNELFEWLLRPHFSLTSLKQEGALLLRVDCYLVKGSQSLLFLKQRKQTASSFYLRQKYYLQITLKSAESIGAVDNLQTADQNHKQLLEHAFELDIT